MSRRALWRRAGCRPRIRSPQGSPPCPPPPTSSNRTRRPPQPNVLGDPRWPWRPGSCSHSGSCAATRCARPKRATTRPWCTRWRGGLPAVHPRFHHRELHDRRCSRATRSAQSGGQGRSPLRSRSASAYPEDRMDRLKFTRAGAARRRLVPARSLRRLRGCSRFQCSTAPPRLAPELCPDDGPRAPASTPT